MAGDSTFRSRLRDALRHSAVRAPAPATAPQTSQTPDAAGDAADAAGAELDRVGLDPACAAPDPARVPLGSGRVGLELQFAAAPVDRVHYEYEEDACARANREQSAWIADALGGAWQHDGQGMCLVLDRVYPGDRRHGNAEIGWYAETLERYAEALHRFDKANDAEVGTGSLFSSLDSMDLDSPPVGWVPGSVPTERLPDGPPSTSDLGFAGIDAPRLPDVRTSGRPDDRRQFLFFDLETTGLSGGAGTCAFLIGFGWFQGQDFRTRQYFLGGFGHESAMLRMARGPLADGRTLASFNGRTFDVPLIQGRYLFHRLSSPFDDVVHIDLLQPARRLWRHRPLERRGRGSSRDDAFGSYFRSAALRQQYRAVSRSRGRRLDLSDYAASCALGVLEDAILGFYRRDDVPGAEIPSCYFHYARTGDARRLVPVLEHNRLDLVSLAAVGSIVARMLHEGADAASNAHECLALGRMYERSGAPDRATACYRRAVEADASERWSGDPVVQREALRRLAVRYRRERRFDEAAAAWQRVLDLDDAQRSGSTGEADLDALLALAVHHEHRSKDLTSARACVLRALGTTRLTATEKKALSNRLGRIDRKMGRGASAAAPDRSL